MGQPTSDVLIFGPQALSFDHAAFTRLYSRLQTSDAKDWIYDAITALPSQLSNAGKDIPHLGTADTTVHLNNLSASILSGSFDPISNGIPNAVLTPIVVVGQLLQYVDQQKTTGMGGPSNVLGFCTGLLSSTAVSHSQSSEDLRRYGTAAITLAMLVGATVDADNSHNEDGPAQSAAVSWSSAEEEKLLLQVLHACKGYISVQYDQNRATITLPQRSLSDTVSVLREGGLTIGKVALFGRFHTPLHRATCDALLTLCESQPALQLPNDTTQLVLRELLVNRCEWYSMLTEGLSKAESPRLLCFGTEKCVPPTVSRRLSGHALLHLDDINAAQTKLPKAPAQMPSARRADRDIAIIGIGSKFSNADDLDELWDVLSSGKSQHAEVPESRFPMSSTFRPHAASKQKWFANLLRNHQGFDHKMFKKTPREAASMDPQQRLMLQAAYHALEQSGYFNKESPEQNIGCYVGVVATDYQHNVACHDPTAYTATGNLSSFIAGKVSHFFGWTGPALVIDTACSSSAVAIHQACQAILAGDCKQAIAGGALVMTSPLWWHNLAGASFLSQTGSCKPFDKDADGYCRGEGVAAILLKSMRDAIADGDQILGCVASTDVRQNENCTPIVVPNSPSLSGLFSNVLSKAGLTAQQITAVEAHGTGTPVGDPAEWNSIRQILGGNRARQNNLIVGSIKGHIGHTECTSGAAALIKVLLMMHHRTFVPQASFKSLNPSLENVPADRMEVLTTSKPWPEDFRAALINNYGASGSNASMIVTQAFASSDVNTAAGPVHSPGARHPFRVSANDEEALIRNASRLIRWIRSNDSDLRVSDLAFNMSKRVNLALPVQASFAASSTEDVIASLTKLANGSKSGFIPPVASERPVILCFGGQVSTFIGLDENVYNSFKVFRARLDHCNSVIVSLGYPSIFPAIFSNAPSGDTLRLQTMLFAMQWSCAMTWIDCGIKVSAAVGHSFGELTALCVCGILSLEDTVRVVARRAQLVRERWGKEAGSMVAVETSGALLKDILAAAATAAHQAGETPPTVACYNGPTSFTVAGSEAAIDIFIGAASQSPSTKTRKLTVTNAFHSTLVEPLMDELVDICRDVTFNQPKIPLVHATAHESERPLDVNFVARHLRDPVQFSSALSRLHKSYPNAIYLEAGSNSTITNMASRAIGSKECHFQALSIVGPKAIRDNLTDVALSLWQVGVPTTHWAHHSCQTHEFAVQLLPSYQFSTTPHWLELKNAPVHEVPQIAPSAMSTQPQNMWSFAGYQDETKKLAKFQIHTDFPQYEEYLTGHIIANEAAICPATVELDIVVEAIRSLRPDICSVGHQPILSNIHNQAPICRDPSRSVWLLFQATSADLTSWSWSIVSESATDKGKNQLLHVTGDIKSSAVTDKQYLLEFSKYQRWVSHARCKQLLEHQLPDDSISGRNIYRVFNDVVDYGKIYQCAIKLVGKDDESAGRVVLKDTSKTWLDAVAADCFSQIGGIWVNCMTDRPGSTIYIANAIEQWIRAPHMAGRTTRPTEYDVFAIHNKSSEKSFCTDVFCFDANTGDLVEVIIGITYVQVSKIAMRRMLARNTPENLRAIYPDVQEPTCLPQQAVTLSPPQNLVATKPPEEKRANGPSVSTKLKTIIAELCGCEIDEIKDDAALPDIGIDSLMAIELLKEIETMFECTIPEEEAYEVVDFPGLLHCVKSHVGQDQGPSEDDSSNSGRSDSGDSCDTTMTSVVPTPAEELPKLLPPTDLCIEDATWLDAFAEMSQNNDDKIAEFGFDDYLKTVNPRQTELCVVMILEAFAQMGIDLGSTAPGAKVDRVWHVPSQGRLVDYFYHILETEAGLLQSKDGSFIRTAQTIPDGTSTELNLKLQRDFPHHKDATELAFYCGTRLADVVQGRENGVKLIFGSEQGRKLVSQLYGEWPLNKLYYDRMAHFLERVAARLPRNQGPLKILEMGGGTAGTTKVLIPKLAAMNIDVEYTFTDLSPAFVAAARKTFKQYAHIMKFRAHNIEDVPAEDLLGTQHIIIASNAIHATHDLATSTRNVKRALRDDGVLLMLEMTSPVIFIDIIFGLFEGWWMFDDDRNHAISHQSRWERVMQSVGYGKVAWTDGVRPENNIERLILGLASGQRYEHENPVDPIEEALPADLASRKAAIEGYVDRHVAGWEFPGSISAPRPNVSGRKATVLVTGATGSLGSTLVADLVRRDDVSTVICMNRRSREDALARQMGSFVLRGIELTTGQKAKIEVLHTDTSLPRLGLEDAKWQDLATRVNRICHNAWPMSARRGLEGFEAQFLVMRHLIDLAGDAARLSSHSGRIGFQLVSSIAVVGHYPLWTKNRLVPEERMDVQSILPNGYGDAKFVCERMLDETLHQHPATFSTCVVRPGQIAGSRISGFWNTSEHLSFLIKSCQILRALPAFEDTLSWTPVEDVAGTCADLLLKTDGIKHPVYHIDNPVRQPWGSMIQLWADLLRVDRSRILPYNDWIGLVRSYTGKVSDNPAIKLIDFLDEHFIRMSCGGLILDTDKSRQHSTTLANVGPVDEATTRQYFQSWVERGFLGSLQ